MTTAVQVRAGAAMTTGRSKRFATDTAAELIHHAARTPSTADSPPSTAASATTERNTWRRSAPTHGSSASSRVRW